MCSRLLCLSLSLVLFAWTINRFKSLPLHVVPTLNYGTTAAEKCWAGRDLPFSPLVSRWISVLQSQQPTLTFVRNWDGRFGEMGCAWRAQNESTRFWSFVVIYSQQWRYPRDSLQLQRYVLKVEFHNRIQLVVEGIIQSRLTMNLC